MSHTSALIISYHPIDFEFVYQLAADLKNAGLPVWLDQLDSNQTSESERTDILLNASGLIAVLSPDYAEAEFPKADLQFAHTRELPVIAVVVRALPAKQSYAHVPAQFLLDFTHWRDERDYRTRLDRLYSTIKARVPLPPTSVEDAETRYLRSLIARLTGHIGNLEFLPVYRQNSQPLAERPSSKVLALWGRLNPLTYTDPETGISSGVLSLAEALEKHPRLLVSGAPGTGKTAVLERLALDLAAARLNAPENTEIPPAIPLLLPVTEWNLNLNAEDFIRASWSLASDPVELAAEGQVVPIFDGLNELGANAEWAAEQIKAYLASESAPMYLLISCRTDHAPRFAFDLPRIEVGAWNADRIRQMADACLDEEDSPIFLDIVDNEPRTHIMTRTPAHLHALALIYKSNPSAWMPTSVGALYKQFFPARWLIQRYANIPLNIKFGDMQAALGRLAVHILDTGFSAAISRADAIKALTSESYLREARDAGLLETRGEFVRFTSMLSLEFFAASVLQPIDLAMRLKNAEFNEAGQRLGGKWDQVAIMMAGISASPDAVVREIAEIDPFLAGMCLASGVEVARGIQDEIGASLMMSAQGKNHGERISAAKALSAIGRRTSILNLLQAMRSGSWRSRRAAADALQESGAPLPARMLDGLSSWNFEMTPAVESVLRELGAEAIPVLMSLLTDEDWIRRRGATWALGVIGDPAAVPGLVDMLRDPDVLVRREAVLALGKTKDTATVSYLLPLLHDVDRIVRYTAADVLVRLGESSIPGLIEALSDEFDEVRATAASALGTMRALVAIEPLSRMMDDPSILVRCEVAKALGQIADPRALATLIELLDDNARVPWHDMRVCDFAAEALRSINTKEALAAWTMWKRGQDGSADASSEIPREQPQLSPLERRQRFDTLVENLNSPNHETRCGALIAMSTLGEPEAEHHLLRMLRVDPEPQVRQVAARALVSFPTDLARIALRAALRDDEVVDYAKDTLISFGAFAVPSLLEALYDTEALARYAAIEALIAIGENDIDAVSDEGIFAALESMIHDSERPRFEAKTIGEAAEDALLILRGTPETDTLLFETPAAEEAPVGVSKDSDTSLPPPSAGATDWVRTDQPGIIIDLDTPEESTSLLPVEANITDTVDTPVAIDEDTSVLEPAIEETSPELEAVLPPINDDYTPPQPAYNDDFVLPPSERVWEELPELIAQMESDNYVLARRAAAIIRSVAYAQAELAQKAKKPSSLDTPEVISILQATLKSEVPLARWAAIEALAYIRNRSTTVSLLDLIHDTSWTLRLGVVRALAEIADADALPAVIEALRDDHGLIRQAACQTLGRIGGGPAVTELIRALRDEETFVRWTAAAILGDMGTPEAVPALIDATRDYSRDVRWSAAVALGKIGDPAAVPALAALLRDKARPAGETQPVHYVAARALYQIGVPEAIQHVRWWRRHYRR